ncbi:RNA polymerase sigma factor [Achromobacter xylosoxidans]|jgi:RNA polymerase sigma-70 factor (ECF subfamily)|uniref:RNA polymerase sigma factor n=1 Tax=Alcaligenes xylosoxydans xylosoxydans TaxID=85698 RepID=UPI001F133D3D|nr:sigma-70 family RNA polymerase sigma factor [Achromobacter xylosoxidans]
MDMSVPFYVEFAVEAGYAVGAADDDNAVAMLRCHLEQHYDTLQRRLAKRVGCADLASECLHDAWLRLGERVLPRVIRDPGAFVYRVACNAALDRLRGERRTVSLADMGDVADLGDELDLPDPQPGPDRIIDGRWRLALLEQALDTLPFRHRCVLFDLYAAGESRAQVARTYGLSLGTLDTLVRQARERYIDVMAAPKPRTHRHRALAA